MDDPSSQDDRDPKHTAIYTRTAAKWFEDLWR
jgi:hypothetical protein